MCGRLDQNDTARNYASAFGWVDAVFESQTQPTFNASPGTFRPVLHVQNGERRVDDIFWSYRPAWAANATLAPGKKRIPIAVNAKVEKLTGVYWRPLLRGGRAIVCASGWYEWTGPKGAKQPWHIHRHDREPLYLLALACFAPCEGRPEEAGFVLITADSLGGMVDIHDRRPVAVSAEDAHRWLDPALAPDDAALLARTAMLDVETFEWVPVSPEVNRAGVDGPRLVEPVGIVGNEPG
jgi:putative SOS response-associated peptidase YedK